MSQITVEKTAEDSASKSLRVTVPVDRVPTVQRYRSKNPRVQVSIPGEDENQTIDGALVFADNAVDPASGTLLLKGEFPNADGRLVAGQFVDVRLVLYSQEAALVVPSPAVTGGQQGTFVYVLNADSTVAPRPITVERAEDEFTIISKGLKAGETVVVEGAFLLKAEAEKRAGGGDEHGH